jgi:3-deoxy-D-manno-octulosonate 8-phosphate phosphatase (KDO 8-P phosphatase)
MSDLELKAIASKIKLMVFDVDGVLTDGTLIFDEKGTEYKKFNVYDGQGIELLHKAGIIPAIITKRNNPTITNRAKTLGIKELKMGSKNKIQALEEIRKKYGFSYEEISYMGDDLPDICVLEKVGLPSCPKNAIEEVKQIAKFKTLKEGGKGAVRELCEFVLKSQFYDLRKLLEMANEIKCTT